MTDTAEALKGREEPFSDSQAPIPLQPEVPVTEVDIPLQPEVPVTEVDIPLPPLVQREPMFYSADDVKDIEKFRLGVWVVKMCVATMMALVGLVAILFMYTAYSTQKLPDMAVLTTVFGHLKDVIVIIIDSEK